MSEASKDSESSPNGRIASFLEGLPTTIRENVYSRLVLAFGRDEELRPGVEPRRIARDILAGNDAHERFRVAVLAAGALDYIFAAQWKQDPALIAQRATRMGSDFLMKQALSIPLREKHYELAAAGWKALRGGALSYETLHNVELRLLSKIIDRLPG